jgi:hypothetical protein
MNSKFYVKEYLTLELLHQDVTFCRRQILQSTND